MYMSLYLALNKNKMTKTKTGSAWENFKNAEVSLITGTLAFATAVVAAYAVMPTYEGATLLQASVANLASVM